MVAVKKLTLSSILLLGAAETALAAPIYTGNSLGGLGRRDVEPLDARQLSGTFNTIKTVLSGPGTNNTHQTTSGDESGTVAGHTEDGGVIIQGVMKRDLEDLHLDARQLSGMVNAVKNIISGPGTKNTHQTTSGDESGTVARHTEDGGVIIQRVTRRDLEQLDARQLSGIFNTIKTIVSGPGTKNTHQTTSSDESGTVAGHTEDGGVIIQVVMKRDLEQLDARQLNGIVNTIKNIISGPGTKNTHQTTSGDESGTVADHTEDGGVIIQGVMKRDLEARQLGGGIVNAVKNIISGPATKNTHQTNSGDESGTVVGNTDDGGVIIGGVLGRDVQ